MIKHLFRMTGFKLRGTVLRSLQKPYFYIDIIFKINSESYFRKKSAGLTEYHSGPSFSKLTMSLVNVSLKLGSLNIAYRLIFLLKM